MAYVINGVLDVGEWKMAARLNSAGNSPSGYNIYGAVDGDAFVFALQSAVDIGFNTTLWLNTDHNTATGHLIFDWLNAGADFNITFVAGSTGTAAPHLYTGASPLHTEAAAQAYAAAIADFAFSTDLNTVEFRVPFSVLGISTAPAVTDGCGFELRADEVSGATPRWSRGVTENVAARDARPRRRAHERDGACDPRDGRGGGRGRGARGGDGGRPGRADPRLCRLPRAGPGGRREGGPAGGRDGAALDAAAA